MFEVRAESMCDWNGCPTCHNIPVLTPLPSFLHFLILPLSGAKI